ncbi:TetR/AcrR family transcriptional regulator [Eubacteriales bacterium mix99]
MTAARIRDSVRTRKNILHSAELEFAEKGFYGARVDRIAERADINKRMIYEYFGGKEKLYRTVLVHVYGRLGEQEVGLLTQDMGCIEAMEKLIRLHFEFLQGNPTYVRLILWENLNQGKHFQKNDFRDARDPSLIQIRKVIRKGKAEGVFRESVEEDQFLLSLITFSFPYFSNRYTLSKLLGMSMDKAEDLNKRVNHVTEILLSYLCREDYRKKKPSNKNGR